MTLSFHKYQGTGNDFILLDNRSEQIHLTKRQIAQLCKRRMGIGADGLILIQNSIDSDFQMLYYNSDGNESTMCGNGGRCAAAFAHQLGLAHDQMRFQAVDGLHEASILLSGEVRLSMKDVSSIEHHAGYDVLDTGSPHYVLWVDAPDDWDVVAEGRRIRHRPEYGAQGINVNFATRNADALYVRTYERGVEEETFSCGTGVTAAAIASSGNSIGSFTVRVRTRGGALLVHFEKTASGQAREIALEGPATFVFAGTLDI